MTDEALSELAECLQDACDKAIASGKKLVPWPEHRPHRNEECCPLGACFNPGSPYRWESAPIPWEVARGIQRGFDGIENALDGDHRAYALGCLLREQYYQ